jgi:hypothetical protein
MVMARMLAEKAGIPHQVSQGNKDRLRDVLYVLRLLLVGIIARVYTIARRELPGE